MATATLSPPRAWRDSKRYLWPLGSFFMGLPMYCVGLFELTGWSLTLWVPTIVFYGFIPLLDLLLGTDRSNAPEERVPGLVEDRYYRYTVYAAVPLLFGTFVSGTWLIATGSLNWYQWLGVFLAVGGASGGAINLAHELGHATSPFDRWLAKLSLAPVGWGHFYVEHNRGHHVRVATFEDPASARFGETFWEFLPRCVLGSVRSAWGIERKRLARRGRGVWSLENEVLQAWGMTVILYAAMTAWLGWGVLPFMILQALYGGSLLEVVNYLEHYGLLREKRADGTYERCQPRHSWNSDHIVSNLMLYHLQRHSDHHANPTRAYQALRHFDDTPQLPSGYSAMVLIAYVPWLWFRVMNPRVIAHHHGDMSKANIKPSIRELVLAKYPPKAA